MASMQMLFWSCTEKSKRRCGAGMGLSSTVQVESILHYSDLLLSIIYSPCHPDLFIDAVYCSYIVSINFLIERIHQTLTD